MDPLQPNEIESNCRLCKAPIAHLFQPIASIDEFIRSNIVGQDSNNGICRKCTWKVVSLFNTVQCVQSAKEICMFRIWTRHLVIVVCVLSILVLIASIQICWSWYSRNTRWIWKMMRQLARNVLKLWINWENCFWWEWMHIGMIAAPRLEERNIAPSPYDIDSSPAPHTEDSSDNSTTPTIVSSPSPTNSAQSDASIVVIESTSSSPAE